MAPPVKAEQRVAKPATQFLLFGHCRGSAVRRRQRHRRGEIEMAGKLPQRHIPHGRYRSAFRIGAEQRHRGFDLVRSTQILQL